MPYSSTIKFTKIAKFNVRLESGQIVEFFINSAYKSLLLITTFCEANGVVIAYLHAIWIEHFSNNGIKSDRFYVTSSDTNWRGVPERRWAPHVKRGEFKWEIYFGFFGHHQRTHNYGIRPEVRHMHI